MLYDIVNMSDSYTIEAKSLDLAFMACLLLGSGQYALEPLEENGTRVPFFMFGGMDEWCQEHFGKTGQEVSDEVRGSKRLELAECLESCLIGGKQDRDTYYRGLNLIDDPKKREEWRDSWLDERRSSMNNIGGRAYRIAETFRKDIEKIPLAPQQVFAS